jgi:hypothetical protein
MTNSQNELLSKNLDQVNHSFHIELSELMGNSWLKLLQSLPSIKNKRLTIDNHEIQQIAKDSCPPARVVNLIARWALPIREIYASFEELNNEKALLYLKKPIVPFTITRSPENLIKAKHGELIEVCCYAKGFPAPYFEIYKSSPNQLVCQSNTYRIDQAKPEEHNGTYNILIKQQVDSKIIKQETIQFEIQVLHNELLRGRKKEKH